MNKKSTSGQSSKSAINPNIPSFVPQSHQWTHSMLMPSAVVPASTAPPYWSPVGPPLSYRPFYANHQLNPQYGPPLVQNHSVSCCLANYSQRAHCQSFDHSCANWSNTGAHSPSNGWPQSFRDYESNANANGIVESITEVQTDSEDTNSLTNNNSKSETESQKKIKQLKETNEKLKTSLEETRLQLKQSNESILQAKERFANEFIDRYRQNLKKYGDYIREECNRFYQNDVMATKLKPIVQQLTVASNKSKEEKERVKQTVAAIKDNLNNEIEPDFDRLTLNFNGFPEFPDLLSFYKHILDEIPLVFFQDLSQLKIFANNFIQAKHKLADSSAAVGITRLPHTLPFGDKHIPLPYGDKQTPLPSISNTLTTASSALFSAPNITDLPKPDFSLFGIKDENMLSLKSTNHSEPMNAPAIELTFPQNPSPIPVFDSFSPNSMTDRNASTPLLNGNHSMQTRDKPLSPIGQPFNEIKNIGNESTVNTENAMIMQMPAIGQRAQMSVESQSETAAKQTLMNAMPAVNSEPSIQSKPVSLQLNQSQTKLLAKLKEKYSHLSDEILVDSMAQTKASLVATGNPKGFSGMKVSDIVSKISEYIDTNITIIENFAKSRITRPIPSLTSFSNNITENQSEALPQKLEPKAWNKVERKGGINNDTICSICFDSISVFNKYETECHHFFHDKCISNWIQKDGSCPICRSLVLPPGEYPQL